MAIAGLYLIIGVGVLVAGVFAIEPSFDLQVVRCPFDARLANQFESMSPLGRFTVQTGPTSAPDYYAFLLRRFAAPHQAYSACA